VISRTEHRNRRNPMLDTRVKESVARRATHMNKVEDRALVEFLLQEIDDLQGALKVALVQVTNLTPNVGPTCPHQVTGACPHANDRPQTCPKYFGLPENDNEKVESCGIEYWRTFGGERLEDQGRWLAG
jgi:hypothetical protein